MLEANILESEVAEEEKVVTVDQLLFHILIICKLSAVQTVNLW